MQQYFISELQKKIIPEFDILQHIQQPQFISQLEQMNFNQLEIYIQQCSLLIQEQNDQKSWIYFGLMLKQVLQQKSIISFEQLNKFAINTLVLIVQVLNIHITSNYLDQILHSYFEAIDRVDDQFWIFLAWHFRNASNNINQLELMKCLVQAQNQRSEFLDILIVKLKIEIEKPINSLLVHKVIISSLQTVLEQSPNSIICQSLLNYFTQVLTGEFYCNLQIKDLYYTIGLTDKFFEPLHLILNDHSYYESFTIQLFNFLLNQIESINWLIANHQDINKERSKENYKLFTKLCQNHFALKLFSANKEKILNTIFTQLSAYIELYNSIQEDTPNELIDLISKQESDTYICSMVRLYVSMCGYVRQFTYLGFLFCSQILNKLFSTNLEQPNFQYCFTQFQYDPQEIQNVNLIIQNNVTTPQTQLQTCLILLTSMKTFLVDQPFIFQKFENLFRVHLTNLTCQNDCSSFKIILMLFLQRFQKKLFKEQEDEEYNVEYLKYILQQILKMNRESQIAIQVFEKITKSETNYYLFKKTLHDINPLLLQICKVINDSDFFQSIINLAKVHEKIFKFYIENYLVVLQERIQIEIDLKNNHAVIKMLQAFKVLYKQYPQEEVYNSKLNVWKLIQFLPYSKLQCFDEELIEVARIFLKFNYEDEPFFFILTFVTQSLEQNPNQSAYIKFLASLNDDQCRSIAEQFPKLMYDIFIICMRCFNTNFLPRKIRTICKILTKSGSTFFQRQYFEMIENFLAQTNNFNQKFFFLCYLSQYNCEETDKYHDEIIKHILNIQLTEVTLQNEAEIFDCCQTLISIYKYTQENFAKAQLQYISAIFYKLVELLHATLLLDDKENQTKHVKLNPVYDQFQQMVSNLHHKTLQSYLSNNFEIEFKLQQLMQARAQFGLVNSIYNEFRK